MGQTVSVLLKTNAARIAPAILAWIAVAADRHEPVYRGGTRELIGRRLDAALKQFGQHVSLSHTACPASADPAPSAANLVRSASHIGAAGGARLETPT
jgi:hypothetical protein